MVPESTDTKIPVAITAEAARRLTDQIKLAVDATWNMVIEAYETRAWVALRYSSWDDYCTSEFGTSRLRLPREDRKEVVASLRDAGLSIRAIAAATGVGIGTVHRELAPVPNGTPEVDPPHAVVDHNPVGVTDDEMAYFNALADIPDTAFDEVIDECKAAGDLSREAVLLGIGKVPNKTIGIDGKSYPRPSKPPAPPKRKRAPLHIGVRSAGWELRKSAERLRRLRDDDRWKGHVSQVAAGGLRSDLKFTVQVCQAMLDEFRDRS